KRTSCPARWCATRRCSSAASRRGCASRPPTRRTRRRCAPGRFCRFPFPTARDATSPTRRPSTRWKHRAASPCATWRRTAVPSARALQEVALTADEYREAVRILGRHPNDVELGIIGALWSEHCGYKTSKPLLGRLPTTGPGVLQGPGENAGAVDIGEGLAAVFKIESHNHPSFIEPYQGAATGVGGIIRDIFTMGARPIALLNSLRFGSLDDVATRRR